eukprot:CCRYP_013916-RA/>CCRYP_013916-RA protein AED:0.75 eAED:1.00 QI:0/0/0/0.5/1/1/2/0/263
MGQQQDLGPFQGPSPHSGGAHQCHLDLGSTTDLLEDNEGLSLPKLDNDLDTAEAAEDFLVNSEVLLPVGSAQELARILHQKRDADGKVIGTAHHNAALDTHVYQIRFPDKQTEELAANVIAEAVYTQCDANGNQYVFLDAIVDCRKDPSIAMAWDNQVFIIDGIDGKRSLSALPMVGNCATNESTKVSSASWQKLLELKESHPLQTCGSAGSSRRETRLSPWLSAEALDTTNAPISTGLRPPRLLRMHTSLIRPLVVPFGAMQ